MKKQKEIQPFLVRYKRVFFGGLFFFFSVFLVSVRDLFLVFDDDFVLYGEKSSVLMKYYGASFLYGPKTQSIEVVWRAAFPYFSKDISFFLQDLPIGKSVIHKDLSFYRVSEHFWYAKKAEFRIFFMGALRDDEIVTIKQQRMSFESDLWVLESRYFPDFIPSPFVGIIVLVPSRVSKKIQDFARLHHIPLLFYKNTGGFLLRNDLISWMLRTRDEFLPGKK